MPDIAELTLAGLSAGLTAREFSSRQIVDAFLDHCLHLLEMRA